MRPPACATPGTMYSEPRPLVPRVAIGGMVIARYSTASIAWYERLIADLEQADVVDLFWRSLHLFGVGRPSLTLRSGCVLSFDSSGPAAMAKNGWQKIAPSYDPVYGLSPAKLKSSREARLVYHLARYRDLVGLSWSPIAEADLRDDREGAAGLDWGQRSAPADRPDAAGRAGARPGRPRRAGLAVACRGGAAVRGKRAVRRRPHRRRVPCRCVAPAPGDDRLVGHRCKGGLSACRPCVHFWVVIVFPHLTFYDTRAGLAKPTGQDQRHRLVGQGAMRGSIVCAVAC